VVLTRFLLLQARNADDPVRLEEQRCFAERLGVSADQISAVDVLRDRLDETLLEGPEILLVGGAGEHSVLDDTPQIRAFIDFVAEAARRRRPMFASCFGFQALVVGLGGEVIHDAPMAEVGSYALTTTAEAQTDPLFSSLPSPFIAQLGHKDRAICLAPGMVNLASSERCPFQAIRVEGAPVYATQFHPEMNWLDNRSRFERYIHQYGDKLFGAAEAQRRWESHQPGPEANDLLRRFVALVAEPWRANT
jgi:GMP synthase (glutamine-hydrolysing)